MKQQAAKIDQTGKQQMTDKDKDEHHRTEQSPVINIRDHNSNQYACERRRAGREFTQRVLDHAGQLKLRQHEEKTYVDSDDTGIFGKLFKSFLPVSRSCEICGARGPHNDPLRNQEDTCVHKPFRAEDTLGDREPQKAGIRDLRSVLENSLQIFRLPVPEKVRAEHTDELRNNSDEEYDCELLENGQAELHFKRVDDAGG